jgi:hypothetical protein
MQAVSLTLSMDRIALSRSSPEDSTEMKDKVVPLLHQARRYNDVFGSGCNFTH